uniref:Arylsulfatase I n=1 Tax=Lygus hesperus TaxID=30085 RepID=A0A0A9YED1_LYGHE
MLDDSLIMFLSDNGGPSIDSHVFGRDYGYNNGASNYPFRGTKMTSWEGGVRVPAVLWKSGLNQTKRTYDNLFHMTDWLPTLNAAAGGDHLAGLDGVNQWSAITGNLTDPDPPRSEFLVEIDDDEKSWAYMKGNHKFIKSYQLTSGRMIFDEYFSAPPQVNSAGYDIQGVLDSSVAKALGTILDRNQSLSLRDSLMLLQSCGKEQQTAAALHDCSYTGCLFDVVTDPTECFDISSTLPDIVTELEGKLNSYKAVLVPKRKPALGQCEEFEKLFCPIVGEANKTWTGSSSYGLGTNTLVYCCDPPIINQVYMNRLHKATITAPIL